MLKMWKNGRALCAGCIIAAAVLLIMLAALLGGNGMKRRLLMFAGRPLTVGGNVDMTEITEFYYTQASSAYPPHWQRYRFYREDGNWYFYHETREGGHWPLTERDITRSGTFMLTDADAQVFLRCLQGGAVSPRKNEADAGADGPWLYLYWQGDGGRYQVFRFASPAEQAAVEALCVQLAADTA